MDESGIHFTFDPQDQFDALREMRTSGLKPKAVYHSHPTTPARLSDEDIRLAVDPNISYVVISLNGDRPIVKSFTVVNKHVVEEEIHIIAETSSDNGTD
jgi:proteasome lid subunit RPN8/RPN11